MRGPHPERPEPRPASRLACLAAASLALLLTALAPADEPAAGPDPLFVAARSAILNNRVEKSRILGCHNERRTFTELPPHGAVLVGFDVGVGRFMDIESVYALRPVYRTRWGERSYADHGPFTDQKLPDGKVVKTLVLRTVRVRARPGYAVGGITLRTGLNINGLSFTFMRIKGRELDPKRSYTSAWIGDRTGGGENYITGDGAPVIGLFGSKSDRHVHSLALLFISQKVQVAKIRGDPLPRPQPVKRPAEPPKAEPPKDELPNDEPPDDPPEDKQPAEPKAEKPAEPKPEPPKGDRPARAAPAPNAEDDAPLEVPKQRQVTASGPNLIVLVIFGVVAVPVFLVLLVSFNRRWGSANRDPREPPRAGPRLEELPTVIPVATLAPGPPTGICERPDFARPRSAPVDPPRPLWSEPEPRQPEPAGQADALPPPSAGPTEPAAQPHPADVAAAAPAEPAEVRRYRSVEGAPPPEVRALGAPQSTHPPLWFLGLARDWRALFIGGGVLLLLLAAGLLAALGPPDNVLMWGFLFAVVAAGLALPVLPFLKLDLAAYAVTRDALVIARDDEYTVIPWAAVTQVNAPRALVTADGQTFHLPLNVEGPVRLFDAVLVRVAQRLVPPALAHVHAGGSVILGPFAVSTAAVGYQGRVLTWERAERLTVVASPRSEARYLVLWERGSPAPWCRVNVTLVPNGWLLVELIQRICPPRLLQPAYE
jgi:hypothetical protein